MPSRLDCRLASRTCFGDPNCACVKSHGRVWPKFAVTRKIDDKRATCSVILKRTSVNSVRFRSLSPWVNLQPVGSWTLIPTLSSYCGSSTNLRACSGPPTTPAWAQFVVHRRRPSPTVVHRRSARTGVHRRRYHRVLWFTDVRRALSFTDDAAIAYYGSPTSVACCGSPTTSVTYL